jgi:hypothetical protein
LTVTFLHLWADPVLGVNGSPALDRFATMTPRLMRPIGSKAAHSACCVLYRRARLSSFVACPYHSQQRGNQSELIEFFYGSVTTAFTEERGKSSVPQKQVNAAGVPTAQVRVPSRIPLEA